MKYISKPIPILDGVEKVSGRLEFAGEIDLSEALFAKLVFSTKAHARITAIDVSRARAIPGVVGIFHHANTPANPYNSTIWFEGQDAPEDEVMFARTVRHVGDRVAAVVAKTQEIAEFAARLIDVTYKVLPAKLNVHTALAAADDLAEGPLPALPNPINEARFDLGDVGAAFAGADLVVRDRVSTPRTHHCAIEPHICIARPLEDGRISILSPCQSVFAVQMVTARALGVPAHEIHAVKSPIGGSFGGKAEPVLEPLCACFARQLGRMVVLKFSRQETFRSTRTRSGATGTIATAVRRDGVICARDTDVLIDVGAYATGGIFLPGSMAQRLCRLYDIKNQRYRGRAVRTNTPPSGAYRGYGSPQIHAISEINLGHVARKLGIDPVDLRLKNLIQPDMIDPLTGTTVGNARIRDCVIKGAKRFHWADRLARFGQRGQLDRRHKSGVGMALATHVNGCFPGFHEATTVTMTVRPDNRIDLICALHDLGCGSNTVLAQIAAEVLDISPQDIVFSPTDTDICAYDLGTRASRMTYICGEAVRQSAESLKAKILAAASLRLNCAIGGLELGGGSARSIEAPGTSIRIADLLSADSDATRLSATMTYRATANPGSYAAHFVEVAVDCLTGAVAVCDYLAVHDLGRAINRNLVEGQIHGGIAMGLGYALFEDIDIDPGDGFMRADRFSKYPLANAPEIPDIDILLLEKHEPSGPFGAKAVGEIATIPVAPAIVNAVNRAIGTNLSDLPLTPERIIAALVKKVSIPPKAAVSPGPVLKSGNNRIAIDRNAAK